jgi:hypothetical protein
MPKYVKAIEGIILWVGLWGGFLRLAAFAW